MPLFQTFEDSDLFHLIGAICGLAIYNLTIVELNFPLVLYKKLLQRPPTLDDLKEMMPDVGRCVPHPLRKLLLNPFFSLSSALTLPERPPLTKMDDILVFLFFFRAYLISVSEPYSYRDYLE